MTNIRFSMCVNDNNGYGQTTRHLRAAQFESPDGHELHLECVDREMVCDRIGDKHIRVGRRKFPILSYTCYVGNMMWDAALVTPEVANAIADVLRKSGKYEPDSGTDKLWHRWDKGNPLFAEAQP